MNKGFAAFRIRTKREHSNTINVQNERESLEDIETI